MVLKKEKKEKEKKIFKVLFEKCMINISFIRFIKVVSFFVICLFYWYIMIRFIGKFIFWVCMGG